MRTRIQLRRLAWGMLGLVTHQAYTQVTIPNNGGGGGAFVGWNAGANQVLDVKNEANQAIDLYTDNLFRMHLNESVTYGLLGGFSSVPADGFALITPTDWFMQNGPKGPFSRLHLAEGTGGNAQELGYRLWQRNGITFTGNQDQSYIGHKYNFEPETDYTDMIIQWSDNPGFEKADRMRFIFTSEWDPTKLVGMNSEEGLEAMRMWPTHTDGVNIGVGDFFEDGTDPSERFHVLDGRVRFEKLPDPSQEAMETFKVMVVDDAATGGERGVVKWKDVADLGLVDCDWVVDPGTFNNVSTAFGLPNGTCPDDVDAVGIGMDLGGSLATAKTTIVSTTFGEGLRVNTSTTGNGFLAGGVFVTNGSGTGQGTSSGTRGIAATSNGAGPNAVGRAGDFISYDNSAYTNGVHAETYAGTTEAAAVYGWCHSNAAANYGVLGRVDANTTTGAFNCGVYGRVDNTTASSWAGWFNGNVMINGNGFLTGMIPITSDENLKTDIETLTNGSDLIGQLRPTTYNMRTEEFPTIHLSDRPQYGLIAQEVETVLPDLVSEVTIPAELDTLGNVIHEAETIKALNYIGLIPVLISAVQTQQALIANLQDQINNCCSAPGGMAPENGDNSAAPTDGMLQEQRLLIIPNPVADITRLEYYVPKAGKVSLTVSNNDGKHLATLREEMAQEGPHNYSWNTTDLAAGTYFCTYMLDGAVVVKRAVKVK